MIDRFVVIDRFVTEHENRLRHSMNFFLYIFSMRANGQMRQYDSGVFMFRIKIDFARFINKIGRLNRKMNGENIDVSTWINACFNFMHIFLKFYNLMTCVNFGIKWWSHTGDWEFYRWILLEFIINVQTIV